MLNDKSYDDVFSRSRILFDTPWGLDSEVFLISLVNSRLLFKTKFDFQKSYRQLYSRDELSELITFLNFNTTWMFIAACANAYLYASYTYEVSNMDRNIIKE